MADLACPPVPNSLISFIWSVSSASGYFFGDPKASTKILHRLYHFWGNQGPQLLGSHSGLTDEDYSPTPLPTPQLDPGRSGSDIIATSFLWNRCLLLSTRKPRTRRLPSAAHLRTSPPSCMWQPTQHPVNNCMFPTPLPLLLGNLFCLWTRAVRFPCSVLCRAWQEAGALVALQGLELGTGLGGYQLADPCHSTASL